MGVASEDSGLLSFPKNLSVWWSEEADNVLQRFERWAAYARGYNRLRSARLSAGRMTMNEEGPDCNRWSINQTTSRLQVDGGRWAPSFRQRTRQRQPAAAERSRLRCCANLDYKSNGNLDSDCLQTYGMDHSIYFKTVGDVRSEKRSGALNGNKNDDANDDAASVTTPSSAKSAPIDCGDFLSSDFDELDSDDDGLEEFDDADYVLREQLDQLAAACGQGSDAEESDMRQRMGEVQLCRSVINEDEVNNNVMMMTGLRRPRHLQLRQLPAVTAQ
ncbi:uncharacterized protein LOC131671963 [Phymastichus coffea]|uniref:uncharacterized protein LOC131671963 n=1 Tax=Phymastichus coffea TaxID=108790 RepID=UPI00273AA7E3|nr:uncharacterized protein LOC131671963 [Phymastichus coffea]